MQPFRQTHPLVKVRSADHQSSLSVWIGPFPDELEFGLQDIIPGHLFPKIGEAVLSEPDVAARSTHPVYLVGF